jgi:hypothetical protein
VGKGGSQPCQTLRATAAFAHPTNLRHSFHISRSQGTDCRKASLKREVS